MPIIVHVFKDLKIFCVASNTQPCEGVDLLISSGE